jgi:hypothetical protein
MTSHPEVEAPRRSSNSILRSVMLNSSTKERSSWRSSCRSVPAVPPPPAAAIEMADAMAAAVAAGESGREIRSPDEIRSPAAAAGRGRQAGSARAKLCTGGTHDEPTDERDLGLT